MKTTFSIMSTKTKLKCIGVIVLAFASSMLASIWPVKLGELYTSISNGTVNDLAHGATAVVTFGLIYLASECITIIRRVSLDCIVASNEADIRDLSIGKLLKVPVSYYSGCLSGEKTAQLNQGVAGFSQLFKISCDDIASTIMTTVCTFVQVMINAPGVTAGIMAIYLVITILISFLQIRSQNGIRENIIEQKTHLDGVICQMISNLEFIRVHNAEEAERLRLLPMLRKICKTEQKHHTYMGIFDCLKRFCKVLFQAMLIVLSLVLIARGQMHAGSVITICLLFQQLTKPVEDVYRFMDETASAVIKSKSLADIIQRNADDIYDIKSSGVNCDEKGIEITDVIVTDPSGKTDLASFDKIILPAGKTIALRGANGCGKSSLIRGITRFYPLRTGEITLFGRNLSDYSQEELSETVYYSPQVPFFIDGSVRENLKYGLAYDVNDSELKDALLKVHLAGTNHDETVIDKDPLQALDIHIGEKANELSGGMKQRLLFARASLSKPKVFIFDEPTANLDASSTDNVLGSLRELSTALNATVIMISHDPKVVSSCDLVIDIHNGLRTRSITNEHKQVA